MKNSSHRLYDVFLLKLYILCLGFFLKKNIILLFFKLVFLEHTLAKIYFEK